MSKKSISSFSFPIKKLQGITVAAICLVPKNNTNIGLWKYIRDINNREYLTTSAILQKTKQAHKNFNDNWLTDGSLWLVEHTFETMLQAVLHDNKELL